MCKNFLYFCSLKLLIVKIAFEKEYLKELYALGKSKTKSYRFQPEIVRKYKRVIDLMISVPNVHSLLNFNSLNYEKLKGDKAGFSSVRVNNKYRIEFIESFMADETIASICNITELSNHYK